MPCIGIRMVLLREREPIGTGSLRYGFTGATEFCGKIFQFGEAVLHGQNRLCIIHMNTRLELQTWQNSGVDIYQVPMWMSGHDVTAAFRAVLPLATFGFLVCADMFGALRDSYSLGLP